VCKQGSLITHVFIAKSRDKQKRVEKQPGQSFNNWMNTVVEKEYLGWACMQLCGYRGEVLVERTTGCRPHPPFLYAREGR
jgi:hypothetical protein